ncbi:MAG: SRPBCC domain-containing protein [Ignavibacteriaceae bacterium]|nr:SRPBCC domain-containing protein [Ignavibacteriaceae bacterium]
MQNENKDTSGREQRTSLLLNAPIELVWEVWTNPELIKHWWGPNGFTNTIEKMEVMAGGEWIFIMHGPDGKDYPNKIIFREVVKNKKIVHEHFDPSFIEIIKFESKGDKTLLNWYKLYETKELFEMVEKHYKTIEGFKQTVEKMEGYVLKENAAKAVQS